MIGLVYRRDVYYVELVDVSTLLAAAMTNIYEIIVYEVKFRNIRFERRVSSFDCVRCYRVHRENML